MRRLRQLSPGTVLGTIALSVALTGTATAGGVALIVTSANIKNGTIKTVDLSAGAKRALKGRRGPRGEAGPAGLPGPAGAPGTAGPPGPRGVANVKHYQTGKRVVPAGAVDGFGMSCPAGEGVISGGGFASIANIAADHVAGNGWIFIVVNDTSIAVDIEGYITCAPGVSVGAVEHATDPAEALRVEQNRLAATLR